MIQNSIINILYKYTLTIKTFMYLLRAEKSPESLQIHSSLMI